MCPETRHKPRFLAKGGQKTRWCPARLPPRPPVAPPPCRPAARPPIRLPVAPPPRHPAVPLFRISVALRAV
ncbi:MAG: hypothetical protein QM296_01860 [Bacillota bacterium]|nr:hypothetical protein [Bacillota bacterium]